MTEQPRLFTERLHLRPFVLDDGPDVKQLAGDRAIASTTLLIPHPYEEGIAEDWIGTHHQKYEKGEGVIYAITLLDQEVLIGSIGLGINMEFARAELGYWIGKPFWGDGYATEAAGAVLAYAFDTLNLNRIYATYLVRNPASGRVLQKNGMKFEGCLRQHVKKWGVFEDMNLFSILRAEFDNNTSNID